VHTSDRLTLKGWVLSWPELGEELGLQGQQATGPAGTVDLARLAARAVNRGWLAYIEPGRRRTDPQIQNLRWTRDGAAFDVTCRSEPVPIWPDSPKVQGRTRSAAADWGQCMNCQQVLLGPQQDDLCGRCRDEINRPH